MQVMNEPTEVHDVPSFQRAVWATLGRHGVLSAALEPLVAAGGPSRWTVQYMDDEFDEYIVRAAASLSPGSSHTMPLYEHRMPLRTRRRLGRRMERTMEWPHPAAGPAHTHQTRWACECIPEGWRLASHLRAASVSRQLASHGSWRLTAAGVSQQLAVRRQVLHALTELPESGRAKIKLVHRDFGGGRRPDTAEMLAELEASRQDTPPTPRPKSKWEVEREAQRRFKELRGANPASQPRTASLAELRAARNRLLQVCRAPAPAPRCRARARARPRAAPPLPRSAPCGAPVGAGLTSELLDPRPISDASTSDAHRTCRPIAIQRVPMVWRRIAGGPWDGLHGGAAAHATRRPEGFRVEG